MAFNGYLLKINGSNFPMKYIKAEDYTITPNQRMESEAKRSVTGELYRTTVEHTATKIEFNTPVMKNSDMESMMNIFRQAWQNTGNVLERKLQMQYYDMETNGYKTGTFYMPDIKFQISRVDTNSDILWYKETRVAFIEY